MLNNLHSLTNKNSQQIFDLIQKDQSDLLDKLSSNLSSNDFSVYLSDYSSLVDVFCFVSYTQVEVNDFNRYLINVIQNNIDRNNTIQSYDLKNEIKEKPKKLFKISKLPILNNNIKKNNRLIFSITKIKKGSGRKSFFRGVSKTGGKWQVLGMHKNKRYYLGSYVNEIEAAKVYDTFALAHFGLKAKVNFKQSKV